jgi:CO dehydrogenase/acetyl-CoA synthase beta subunit
MVRSSSTHIWSRVSNQAVARGFNFATLGRAIEQHVKAQIPRVEAVELVFITSGEEDVNRLGRIATEAEQTARDIRQRVWQQRGVDIFECTKGGHCGKCGDKEVCDRIRGMMGRREDGSPDLAGEQAE